MKYEDFVQVLDWLWSGNGLFKGEAVRHRDMEKAISKFCAKRNWNDDNATQQLSKAVKKSDIEKFLFEDGVHKPRPYYRPIGSNYFPKLEEVWDKIKQRISETLSREWMPISEIAHALPEYDYYDIINVLRLLAKQQEIDYLPPRKAQFRSKL